MICDELQEVSGHGVAVVCDEHPVLFSAQPEDFPVVNAGVQAEFWRALKINGGLESLGRPQNIFVQIVVSLKSDFHLIGSGRPCLIRALRAAPLGNNRSISWLNCSSVASWCARYSSSSP